MNEQERREAIWRLYNPQIPDPFVSHDYGVLYRDLPPRRTIRERLRFMVWWHRQQRAWAAEEAQRRREWRER
jgi:hypothetical protein